MKTLVTKILASGGIALLMLVSCKKDGSLTTVRSSSTTAATLSASTTTPALVKANLTATAVTFTATAPSYGYSAAITNTLQFDVKGDNFATPKKEVVLPAGAISQSYTVQDLNNILLGMNLATGASAQIEVRVKSSLSSTAGIVYSNVVGLSVTPFALVSYVYVPGAYQGWNPSTADSLQSATGNGVYTGIINFTAGNNQFLVTPAKNWNNKWATGDAATTNATSASYTVTYNGANNFYAPTTAGQYWVTLNTNTNTMTITPADYYSIIGDAALGWGADVDLKFNNGSQLWTSAVPIPLVSTGSFKFRKDHQWATSYGWPSTGPGATLTSANGANISISASGNYAITFAVSATDATVATYTAVKQ
ncbi:MAG: SusE domain-containing protein [Mucilaginibacter sp.]|nr:SusE domain-containing protein [Mucilaginibacter sp.]